MDVRALRGVCIGPERHLAAGEHATLDESLALYLISIGAVEQATAPAAPATQQPAKPAKAGKSKE